jgi:hypothetical protein
MINENYETKKCAYCGEDANTVDHIIPVSYYYSGKRSGLHLTSEYGKENLADCCQECNYLASNKVFDSLEEKRKYIQEKLTIKYKKIINSPFWNDDEIKEMGYKFKKEIKIQQLSRKWILNRINYPIEIYPIVLFNKEIQKFINKEL